MAAWDPTFPPEGILRPQLEWEGANDPRAPSDSGIAPEEVNQLRDPSLFQDADGELYLFYCGRGEDAIGLARLIPTPRPGRPVLPP